MNLKELDKLLKSYTPQELFYKKYFDAKSHNTYYNSIKNLNLDYINNNTLTTPKSQIPLITENTIIGTNSNIKIQKHCRYKPGFTHSHEFFQLTYIYSGTCNQNINGRSLNLTKSNLLILAPNVPHTFKVCDNSIILNIFICKSDFNELFQELLKENNVLSQFFLRSLYTNKYEDYILFYTNNDKNLKTILLNMLSEQLNNKKYSERIITNMLLIFFQYLMQDHEKNYETSSIITKNNKDINEILTYIQKNYASITLNQLSNKFHFSNAYLSKHLKECTGNNFSQIIKYIKLKKSCNLLKSTNMNVYQISSAVGYSSEEHFIRTFKKEFNMSPTQYRKSI